MGSLQAWTSALAGSMSQSYKPIVAMVIFDLAQEEIKRDDFVQRVSEFFWQLERRFSLNHGPVNNDVQQQIKACIGEQENETWAKVWSKLGQSEENKTRSPRDFIWTKLREMPLKKLPSSTTETLYHVTENVILLPHQSIATIQANKKALLKLARFMSWVSSWNGSIQPVPVSIKKSRLHGRRSDLLFHLRTLKR